MKKKTGYKQDPNEITFDELDTLTVDKLDRRSNGYCGFYDWFCSDSSLVRRAKRLLGVMRRIAKTKTKRFDPAGCYVFFKNNCPCSGGTYDDLRICDKKTGDVLINVCPSRREIWTAADGWKKPIKFACAKDLYSWFRTPEKEPAGRKARPLKRIIDA